MNPNTSPISSATPLVHQTTDNSTWSHCGNFNDQGHQADLDELYESAERDQVHPLGILTWLRALAGLGRQEEAITWGLRGCLEYPDDAEYFVETAELMVARGRSEEAEALLAKGPENLVGLGPYWLIRAHCHAKRNEGQQGRECIRRYGACNGSERGLPETLADWTDYPMTIRVVIAANLLTLSASCPVSEMSAYALQEGR